MKRIAVVAGVLIVLSVWAHGRPQAADAQPFDFAGALPFAFGEWVGRDAPPLDADAAKVLAADQYVHRYYGWQTADRKSQTPDGELRIADVEVDIAYYVQPQAGAAMHSPLNCLPGNGWQVLQSQAAALGPDGSAARVRRLVVARGADRVAMTYWFQNRGAMVGNEYWQRVQLLTNGLQDKPTDAALVRVMALDTPAGRDAMQRFSRALATLLSASFR